MRLSGRQLLPACEHHTCMWEADGYTRTEWLILPQKCATTSETQSFALHHQSNPTQCVLTDAGNTLCPHLNITFTHKLLDSCSTLVGVKIKKNILMRPIFIKTILKSINNIILNHVIWQTIPHVYYSRTK